MSSFCSQPSTRSTRLIHPPEPVLIAAPHSLPPPPRAQQASPPPTLKEFRFASNHVHIWSEPLNEVIVNIWFSSTGLNSDHFQSRFEHDWLKEEKSPSMYFFFYNVRVCCCRPIRVQYFHYAYLFYIFLMALHFGAGVPVTCDSYWIRDRRNTCQNENIKARYIKIKHSSACLTATMEIWMDLSRLLELSCVLL